MWTYNQRPIRIPTPPMHPREWVVTTPIPDGIDISDHAAHDRMARDLAPEGYMLVGTIPVSRCDAPRDRDALRDPRWWRIRITYYPESWRRELRGPLAVYAAAQMAGLATDADDVMTADYHGIQYHTPDGRPTWRDCGDWSRDLPDDVRRALSEMRYISQRRRVGYDWGRPTTGRAMLAAARERDDDDRIYARAVTLVRTWVREHHPEICSNA